MEEQPSNLGDICKTVSCHADIQKVWDAISTSNGIAAWFMPNDFQPHVGHHFTINAGPFGISACEVLTIEPPLQLAFRWGKDWTLSIALKEVSQATECTLIHSGWDMNKKTEFGQPHAVVRQTMDQGWTGIMKKLVAYVEK